MQPQTVGAILDAIGKHWRVAADVEVTLEANPTSVEATRFRGYRAAGVNRVSLGVQALDDASLKALGRLHTAREALDAVAIARTAFDRYSFDLIYARPDQTPQMWADELKLAISEAAEHLSLYQLTIEEGTPFFGLHAAGKLKTPDEALARALYDVTQEVCAQQGLPAYEISNHARAGAECQHNLVYWRGEEYAGIGPGAHGRLDIDGIRHAIATEKRPEAWLMRVEANGHGVVTDDLLNSEERADEFLLMGLRLAEGIDPQRYAALVRPRARSGPDRHAARGRRHHRRCRRPAARDARPDFRCSMPSWRISRRKVPYAPKLFGEPATGVAPPVATRITARPRSLVPSERKRNRPSMPAKPDGLVSVSGAKRCAPCVLRQRRDQRHRVIGQRRGAHRLARRIWCGSGRRKRGSPTDPARHKGRPAARGSRTRADCPTDRCRATGCCCKFAPAAVSASAVATTDSPSSAMKQRVGLAERLRHGPRRRRAIGAVFLERDDAPALAADRLLERGLHHIAIGIVGQQRRERSSCRCRRSNRRSG